MTFRPIIIEHEGRRGCRRSESQPQHPSQIIRGLQLDMSEGRRPNTSSRGFQTRVKESANGRNNSNIYPRFKTGTIYKIHDAYPEGGAGARKHENRATVSQAVKGKNPFRDQFIVNRLLDQVRSRLTLCKTHYT